MPARGAINPKTGKRLEWEEEQKRLKEAQGPTLREIRESKELLIRQRKVQESRESFLTFIKFTMPDPEDVNDVNRSRYKDAKHHRATAKVLETFIAGDLGCEILILVEPPRHGKSEQVSRRLPAWVIGKFPQWNGVVATYNDDFAADFGKNVRDIVKTSQFRQVFPKSGLKRGGAASDRLETLEGGQWSFVGRGGSLTGRGAHILICDDLIKDDKEAQSQAIRDQAWSWLTRVAFTRRMGRKLVILTFTRWHNDDPIGRLTDPENPYYSEVLARKIKVIRLPAIAEEDDDPLGRKIGEPLWPDGPDRFDLDFLETQKALDPIGFAALYQGRPSLTDGDLYQRETIKFYKPGELPEELRIYCASDHAVGIKQRNDFTVLLKYGIDKNLDIWLLECIWRKMKSDQTVESMLAMIGGNMRPLVWFAESGHISKSIGPFLRKRMTETGTFVPIREINPTNDKVQRAQSMIGRAAMGKLHFPIDAVWTERAINEMMAFPSAAHDDFVDTLSLVGLQMQSQFAPSVNSDKKKNTPPAFGTLAWVKHTDKWSNEERRRKAAGGF
jgi:predicted phage terminase large subunit-like protein